MPLTLDEINRTAGGSTSSVLHLPSDPVVYSEPTIDSRGDEALRVTVVLSDDAASKMDGEMALDILVKISDDLRAKGEERFPIVEFATEEEWAAGDDPES